MSELYFAYWQARCIVGAFAFILYAAYAWRKRLLRWQDE